MERQRRGKRKPVASAKRVAPWSTDHQNIQPEGATRFALSPGSYWLLYVAPRSDTRALVHKLGERGESVGNDVAVLAV
jgi:hypothetical protein